MPRSSVIIPAYNQAALTAQCVDAVLASGAGEIIVVDDGSTDDTPRLLRQWKTRIHTVRHEKNLGFATSCNDGARLATGDFLIFLNNDTIPQPGWWKALEDYANRHPTASVVGSKLLFPDLTVQHAGVAICQDGYPRHLYTGFPADHPVVNRSRRLQLVSAACMLVRKEAFSSVGGFDAAFRNGFEDVDLCLRLGEHNHEIHYCAESVVIHLESVSPGRFRNDRRNVALFRTRWLNRVRPDDLEYYVADGLLALDYEGRFPIHLEVSPLLATLNHEARVRDTEILLREHCQHVAELQRENVRLSLALGSSHNDSPVLRYRKLRQQIREAAQQHIPAGSTVLVISKGDRSLCDLPGRTGWHFPQTERGVYAGHHPADSAEAIAQLETLRRKGARYVLIPATSLWWQEHYLGFNKHLQLHSHRTHNIEGVCVIHELKKLATSAAA